LVIIFLVASFLACIIKNFIKGGKNAKRPGKILLVAIFFHVLAIIFIALNILGFFPDSWERWTDIVVILILCELLIEVLLSINK